MDSQIDKILKNTLSFLGSKNNQNDIVVISSRIRLARNLKKFVFPVASSIESLKDVRNSIDDVFEKDSFSNLTFLKFFVDELPSLDQEILFERRLISRKLLDEPVNRAVYCSSNEKVSVMVNEEDHLRIQTFNHGFNLQKTYKLADMVDNKLNQSLEYSFDPRLGYLSSCPSNVGTGLRASVMMHLIGLQINGELDSAVRALNKLNFAVRGIFGEGSSNVGSLFQISNQLTLGHNEEELIEKLQDTLEQIISYELNAREVLFKEKQYQILDFIGRSYGLLKHSYILDEKELLNAISGVKLGVDMGIFSNLDISTIHEIFIRSANAHLQKMNGYAFKTEEERNIYRASFVREQLRKGRV